jgi:hypothetical protein
MELSPVSRIASAIPEGVSFFKLKRETISDPFLRKIKQQGVRTVYGRAGRIQRVRLPKKVAKARREALRKYFGLSREFLSQPENHGCKICAARIASGENMAVNRSTETHHFRQNRKAADRHEISGWRPVSTAGNGRTATRLEQGSNGIAGPSSATGTCVPVTGIET